MRMNAELKRRSLKGIFLLIKIVDVLIQSRRDPEIIKEEMIKGVHTLKADMSQQEVMDLGCQEFQE